jgi:uncharacterized protein Smg (DUF494 family)
MTIHTEAPQEWWLAVRSISDLVSRDGIAPEESSLIRTKLSQRGFSSDGIGKALDWMDKAALSGTLMDTLGMLQPVASGVRVDHALEKASLHPRLLRAVETCRRRGWLGQDQAERLLESLRGVDSRDWDDADVEAFLADILGISAPSLAGMKLSEVLGVRSKDHYN